MTEEFLDDLWDRQGGLCALTGLEMDREAGDRITAPSLDRIDSTGHYTQDNVWFVLNAVNVAKNALLLDKFVALCRLVVRTHAEKTRKSNPKEDRHEEQFQPAA